MVSEFGDLYDHTTDVVGGLVLLLVVWHRFREDLDGPAVGVFLGSLGLLLVAIGCYQRNRRVRAGEPERESLDAACVLCPVPEAIRVTRWFGCGTFQWVLTGLVLVLHCRRRRRLP